MSDEKKKLIYDEFIGKQVMIQLRSYAYVGVTGKMQPMTHKEMGYISTPVILGTLVDYDDHVVKVETTDPEGAQDVRMFLLISRTDLGPITYAHREDKSLIL